VIKTTRDTGVGVTDLPILNAGTLSVNPGIHWNVNGHAGGGNGPSILQTAGLFNISSSTAVVAQFGVYISGGDLRIGISDDKAEAVIQGKLTFAGDDVVFINLLSGSITGGLEVRGDVDWISGTYNPIVDGTNGNKTTLWWSTGAFKVGGAAALEPQFRSGTAGNAGEKNWKILEGKLGIKNGDGTANATPPTPTLPVGQENNYDMQADGAGVRVWKLHRKP
jgi:hypothetical protein